MLAPSPPPGFQRRKTARPRPRRPSNVYRLFSDQRDIGDPERQQQRQQPAADRVRQLWRRVPRRHDETRAGRPVVGGPGPGNVAAAPAATAAAAAAVVASHENAAAVGPALRQAVVGERQVAAGRSPAQPSPPSPSPAPAQQLRAAVAAVLADSARQQPHRAKPHRRFGHITFTRLFAF